MNLTPHYIIISKVINRLSQIVNWLYRVTPVKWIVSNKVGKLLKATNKRDLEEKLNRILGIFQELPEKIIESDDTKTILEWADNTLRHEFEYLGSGLIKLDQINWHFDFKSGHEWKKGKFYKTYNTIDLSNNSDVKVPWELSRCHHLLWLGEAYLLTKDEKYAKEAVDQIEWWIVDNPLMYSINWTCAMDVAIRAVNWMYTANMIVSSEQVTEAFTKKITRSLYEHGWFIYNNLEKWYPYSANHYAANIAGLLFLGQFFNNTTDGKKWWKYALNEYFLEIRLQVLPSGAHFERTISYHRLMTELFCYPYTMLKRVNEQLPLDITARIESMFNFIDNYTKPNGLSPQIGDSDDGRFLPFVKRDFRDHRYLLNIASSYFLQRYENVNIEVNPVDHFFLMPQLQMKTSWQNIVSASLNLKDHRDAGFVIIKSSKVFLMFINSSLSSYYDLNKKTLGTHTHADGLSFELSIGDDDFFIDPGSYVYTASAEKRNEFRSTKMHNTISLDNLNQMKLSETNLFSVRGFKEPDEIQIEKIQTSIYVSGTRRWSIENSETVLHKREITLHTEPILEINDEIYCNNPHTFNWYFQLAPGVEAILGSNTVMLNSLGGIKITMTFDTSNAYVLKLVDSVCSPSYGVIVPTLAIHLNVITDKDFTFKTLIGY